MSMKRFNMKGPLISIVLPTYNESTNVGEMIHQILHYLGNNIEIIVVDDNSADGTWKIAKETAPNKVKVIRRLHKRGVGSAIFTGIKKASGRYIVWMDCDLSMPPHLLPRMIGLLSHYDVVVGSRYVMGGKDARSVIRVVTSRTINLLANLILNFKVLDYDSGFIATKREVVDNVSFNPKGHGEYCIEFLYKAGKKSFKIKEIGYVFTERKKGESKTARYFFSILLYGAHYIWRILKIRFINEHGKK